MWVEFNQDIPEELLPDDGEIFLVGDDISDLICLGKWDEEKDTIEFISMDKMERDSQITHIMRIPKLPRKSYE